MAASPSAPIWVLALLFLRLCADAQEAHATAVPVCFPIKDIQVQELTSVGARVEYEDHSELSAKVVFPSFSVTHVEYFFRMEPDYFVLKGETYESALSYVFFTPEQAYQVSVPFQDLGGSWQFGKATVTSTSFECARRNRGGQ
jgi:hypothetical protein